MDFIEITAKTVDEAVAEALEKLNITADEAVIEVLEKEQKGFLGMFSKNAKVRVNIKETSNEFQENNLDFTTKHSDYDKFRTDYLYNYTYLNDSTDSFKSKTDDDIKFDLAWSLHILYPKKNSIPHLLLFF